MIVTTVAETQMAELSAWLASTSRDDVSPKGDTIKRSLYGHLVGIIPNDLPPDMTQLWPWVVCPFWWRLPCPQ